MLLHQVCTSSSDDGYPGAYALCSPSPPGWDTVQVPASALHEASTALQDLQAMQHIFLASDLYLTNKACLQIGSHML